MLRHTKLAIKSGRKKLNQYMFQFNLAAILKNHLNRIFVVVMIERWKTMYQKLLLKVQINIIIAIIWEEMRILNFLLVFCEQICGWIYVAECATKKELLRFISNGMAKTRWKHSIKTTMPQMYNIACSCMYIVCVFITGYCGWGFMLNETTFCHMFCTREIQKMKAKEKY